MTVVNLSGQQSKPFKERLKDGSTLADPKFLPPVKSEGWKPPAELYGVERDGDKVKIMLGTVDFELPVEAAIKFALVMLKKCGVQVDGV